MLSELKTRADQQDIPVNATIVKILMRAMTVDRFSAMFPTMIIPAPMLAKIFQNMEDRDLDSVAAECFVLTQQIFQITEISYPIEGLVRNYFAHVAKYYRWYDFNSYMVQDEYRLVFKTSMGKKWCKFISIYARLVLESLVGSNVSTWIGQDTVILKFHLLNNSANTLNALR